MTKRLHIILVTALSLVAAPYVRAEVPPEALEMYRLGVYGMAMPLFAAENDPLSQDYATLCAVKLALPEAGDMVAASDKAHVRTILNSTIHRDYGLLLFDSGKFAEALAQFEQVNPNSLDALELAELNYKMGHCLFDADCCEDALEHFEKTAGEPGSEYLSAARYFIGCIHYQSSRFRKAEEWFRLAQDDPRFKDLCAFYLVDCRFMLKDYDYVIEQGEMLFPNLPEQRAKHISRLISEAWMVKGNAAKAKDFLVLEGLRNSTDESLFHAASVLYASHDYREAASYFASMKNKTDSVGQVAQYHLGDSYIHLGNKVAAMNSFKAASDLAFNPDLQEDAFFNYAKLAFDVNSDVGPFKEYLARYSTSRKGEIIYGYIAITALASRDYAAAVEAYDNIEKLDSDQRRNYVKANFLLADQLRRMGSYKEAAKYLRFASVYLGRQDRLGQMCRYYMAEYLYRSSDLRGASELYTALYNESALYGTPEGQQIPYDLGCCLSGMGEYADAARFFDKYLSSRAKTVRRDALTRRADADFALRNYTSAAVFYQKVLDEYPSDSGIYPYYQLGLAYGLSGVKDKKVAVLSRIISADPAADFYMPALGEYARALLETGRPDEARSAFELLLKNASEPEYRAEAIMGISTILRNGAQYAEAIEGFKKVVKMLPRSAQADDALLNLKAIYLELGTPEIYVSWLESVGLDGKVRPEELDQMFYSGAESKFLAGRLPEAEKAFLKYLRDYPQGDYAAEAYYSLGECARAALDRQKAADCYAKSLDVKKDGSVSELAALGKADMKYELGLYEEAYLAYHDLKDMAGIADNRVAAVVGIMRTSFRTKRFDECISASSSVLKLSSDDALGREAKYDKAKSYLSTSRRNEAFELLRDLRKEPATAEGAEACYLIIRAQYDWGNYSSVQDDVYDFAQKCGDQSYWLAKAFLVLGDSFAASGNAEQARVTYQSVLDGYKPYGTGDDVPDEAAKKLSSL